jgi:sarcosine oxidase, subunit gamma
MLEANFDSALSHRDEPANTSINMREIALRGMIDLRGLSTDKKFLAAAKTALGFDLPKAPRTSSGWGDVKALWLSPDQWLILSARDKAPVLLEKLNAALGKIHSLAVDVSDMRAIIRLEGEGVRETLMKGCSLDLLSEEYAPGTIRRVRFAEIAALIHIVEDNTIDLYVFRSYADYAWEFLLKAARKGSEVKLFAK